MPYSLEEGIPLLGMPLGPNILTTCSVGLVNHLNFTEYNLNRLYVTGKSVNHCVISLLKIYLSLPIALIVAFASAYSVTISDLWYLSTQEIMLVAFLCKCRRKTSMALYVRMSNSMSNNIAWMFQDRFTVPGVLWICNHK